MALQNRVDPFGKIISYAERGTFMGNRGGELHNERREIVREFKTERWITCLLQFKGRKRTVMSPRLYTELFFLDEAVSFSAGHRPCAECRRDRYNVFRDAWIRSRDIPSSKKPSAEEIDTDLHRARFARGAGKITYQACLDILPDGCFVVWKGSAYLLSGNELLKWSAGGYHNRIARSAGSVVNVLTPEPLVRCFQVGYRPEMHESASELPR